MLVIGAGPAGSAAAIACAQRGMRVALLERCTFPRERPGETLHPGVEPLLQQLGIAEQVQQGDFLRHTGSWVHWGGAPRFSAFGEDAAGPWRGFQIPRATLGQQLLQRAASLGVKVLQPCEARTVLVSAGRVQGVQTPSSPLHASYLIDASGSHGWLSRQLGLVRQKYSPTLIAQYGYRKGTGAELNRIPAIVADEEGWYWVAQIAADRYHWTRVWFSHQRARRSAVPGSLAHLEAVGGNRGADVSWRFCNAAAGPGYFIVGDAAAVLDPGASHGVIKALMSGMQAAQAIADCLDRPACEIAAQHQYRGWMSDWFERDRAAMLGFYHAHPVPPGWLDAY